MIEKEACARCVKCGDVFNNFKPCYCDEKKENKETTNTNQVSPAQIRRLGQKGTFKMPQLRYDVRSN